MLNKKNKVLLVLLLTTFSYGYFSNYANAAKGVIYFDVQPRIVQGGQVAQFDFKVTLTDRDCGPIESNLRWVISRKISNGSFGAFQSGEVLLNSFIDGISKDLSFPKPLFSVPTGTGWIFSAKIYCGAVIPSIIAVSSDVPVTVSGGSTGGGTQMIYGCIANDGKYACSQSDVSTCADSPVCSDKVCVQVDKTRCGQLAGSGGIVPGKPGQDISLGWSIKNPLVGNPQDVFGVVVLVSNWLLNIAGTLIVILIIYSGVRFMLSKGNPSEYGKAKDILKWALIGFAVILIGKGFVFIVDSVLRGQLPF